MIHKLCLDLLGRLIKAEGECCALKDFSRLRELLLLLCPIFFVSPSVFLPGARSVPLWAKPRSLVCTGWCMGYLGLLFHCPFPPGGHCLSAKLSCVTALLWESSAQLLVVVALGMFPQGKCHQLAYLAPVNECISLLLQTEKVAQFPGLSAKLFWVNVGDRKHACW